MKQYTESQGLGLTSSFISGTGDGSDNAGTRYNKTCRLTQG